MSDPGNSAAGALPEDDLFDDEFELACSSCNAELDGERLFQTHRVCPHCRRHYWMPARERIDLLVDPGSFQETSAQLISIDPLLFHDRLPVADRLAEAREQPSVAEAVVTGTGWIGGHQAVIVALDLAVFGAGIGIVAGEKIALAMEHAVTRRLPTIAICSGGSGKGQEGVLALGQIGKLASAASRLHRVGVPLIALLSHPTTGNVLTGLAYQADFAFAEPGSQTGAVSSRDALAQGALDGLLDREHQRDQVEQLMRLLGARGSARQLTVPAVSGPGVRAHDEMELARNQQRPNAANYIARLASDLVELHGDRVSDDASAITGGIGRIGGVACIVAGAQRYEGLSAPAFAKVNRLLRLAAHLELPVVIFVETSGQPDEAPATSLGIAQTLALLAAIPVPIVSVAIGEVTGLGGIALLTADRVVMQEHAVISWRPAEPVASARDCLRLGLIDAIVGEPAPAADEDPARAAEYLESAIADALAGVLGMGTRRLIDERTRRMRNLGLNTAEGREVARVEWRELQDVQRMIGRSIDDLKHRWEHRQLSIPTLTNRPPSINRGGRPQLPTIVLPKFTIKKAGFTELANRMQTSRRGLALRDPKTHEEAGESPDEQQ